MKPEFHLLITHDGWNGYKFAVIVKRINGQQQTVARSKQGFTTEGLARQTGEAYIKCLNPEAFI